MVANLKSEFVIVVGKGSTVPDESDRDQGTDGISHFFGGYCDALLAGTVTDAEAKNAFHDVLLFCHFSESFLLLYP